jgi:hypothetical protein
MTQITIALDDEVAAQLRALAQQRGESVEQTVRELLTSTLPPAMPAPRIGSDDPDGSRLLLSMSGSLMWPGVEGTVDTPNEEIDRIVAEEALNPHDDQ